MARWMTVTAMVMFFMPQIVSAQHQPYSGLQERPVKRYGELRGYAGGTAERHQHR